MQAVASLAVWHVKLEESEFNCALGEGCVQVEHVVAAAVVVLISAAACVVCCVPYLCEVAHCLRLLLVELLDESGIRNLAVLILAAAADLDCVADQLLVSGHQVCKVPQALWCVALSSDVNVYSAADSCMAYCSGSAELSDQLLQEFNV